MVKTKAHQAKMTYAFFRFKDHNPNSHLYERFKIEYSKTTTGENNPAYGKKWCHDSITKEIFYLTEQEREELNSPTLVVGLYEQRGGFKNYKCINNGIKDSMIPEDQDVPKGWVDGRLYAVSIDQLCSMSKNRHTEEKDEEHRKKLTGRKRIINHATGATKSVDRNKLADYFAQGFVLNDAVVTSLSKRCQIDGIVYESFASAAKKLCVGTQTLVYRLHATTPRWVTWIAL
jgi:hypothetical protein